MFRCLMMFTAYHFKCLMRLFDGMPILHRTVIDYLNLYVCTWNYTNFSLQNAEVIAIFEYKLSIRHIFMPVLPFTFGIIYLLIFAKFPSANLI